MKVDVPAREEGQRGASSESEGQLGAATGQTGSPVERCAIPRVVYQTWRTKDGAAWTPRERRWVRSWRDRSGLRHEMHDDDDCLALVREHFPEQLDTYRSLRRVEKADLWRYLVLYLRGGVYSDFDTVCRTPVDAWLRTDDEVVVGLMSDFLDEYPDWRPQRFLRSGGAYNPGCPWRDNPAVFTNWTIAARPRHPLLADVIRRVAINALDPYFRDEDPSWTVKKTGPGVLTDALSDHLAAHGASTSEIARRLRRAREVRVGGVRLLDYAAFHTRYVVHLGMRSWAPDRRGLDWVLHHVRMALT
jgi:mannosyltransferase OCH1-like enzyme